GHAELIFRTDRAEVDAAIFERDAAATAVVIHLHDLVLQYAVGDVVADARSHIKTFAIQTAITDNRANLIRKRLKLWIILKTEVRDRRKEFSVRFDFNQRPNDCNLLQLRIVFQNLLGVVAAAWRDFNIADDWRRVARTKRKGKRGDRIESPQHVSLAIHNGAAKGRIEIMFLHDAPGNELLGLVVATFQKEPLGEAVFHFVRVAQCCVGIEANEALKIADAADVTESDVRLDGVLVAVARLVFFERRSVKKAFESRGAKFESELTVVACERLLIEISGRVQRRTITRSSNRAASRQAEPLTEVDGNCHARGEFRA